jgi:hypothetical protein
MFTPTDLPPGDGRRAMAAECRVQMVNGLREGGMPGPPSCAAVHK